MSDDERFAFVVGIMATLVIVALFTVVPFKVAELECEHSNNVYDCEYHGTFEPMETPNE